MKRSPMNRKTPLRQTGKGSKRRDVEAYNEAKREVMRRSNGSCEARVEGVCGGPAEHAHHKKRRGQGGTDDAANLIGVCFSCHSWIHDHPEESIRRGFLIASASKAIDESWLIEYNEKPWTHNAERRMNMHARGKLTKQWRTDFCLLAKYEKIPRLVWAKIIVTPYQSRGKLQDVAACAPAAKAAIDGIVDAGVLPDDSSRYVTSIEFRVPERGTDKLILEIIGVREES
jgi:hypothetical protein